MIFMGALFLRTFSMPQPSWITTTTTITEEDFGFQPQKQQQPQQQNDHYYYKPVDCQTQLESRTATDSNNNNNNNNDDPNKNMKASPKRHVDVTFQNDNQKATASFWVSLHAQGFDPHRWKSIMKEGQYYETGVTDQFFQILHNQPPGLVIDIGMNIGWFTLLSRALGHAVVAVDPNPIMHTRVCESLVLNGWMNNNSNNNNNNNIMVKTYAYGLGTTESTLELKMGWNPGASSFLDGFEGNTKVLKTIPVPVIPLDRLAQQEGWLLSEDDNNENENEDNNNNHPKHNNIIYLMKMDVEGYEPMVLRGGHKLLQHGNIQNILMENTDTGPEGKRLAIQAYMDMYHQGGYELSVISDNFGKPMTLDDENNNIDNENKETMEHMVNKALKERNLTGIALLADRKCNLWWKKRQ